MEKEEITNIYKTIFDSYKNIMKNKSANNDGATVIEVFQRAINAMIEKGDTTSKLHKYMSKWVVEQTLRTLDKMPKGIKEYAKELGIWKGNVAVVVYGQYTELKNDFKNWNYRSKEKFAKYLEMLDNDGSAPILLFGMQMMYNDFPTMYFSREDEKEIKDMIDNRNEEVFNKVNIHSN